MLRIPQMTASTSLDPPRVDQACGAGSRAWVEARAKSQPTRSTRLAVILSCRKLLWVGPWLPTHPNNTQVETRMHHMRCGGEVYLVRTWLSCWKAFYSFIHMRWMGGVLLRVQIGCRKQLVS